jgi:hypothetical protein
MLLLGNSVRSLMSGKNTYIWHSGKGSDGGSEGSFGLVGSFLGV